MFFRVREEFEPYSFPRVAEACRYAFSFHYGENTGPGYGGKPRSVHDNDTVIRIDDNKLQGPHICYQRTNHILQEHVSNFEIDKTELFSFLDAVKTVRQSRCSFEDILLFKINWSAVHR
jgi:hypothetical protein